jgi:hypothetical protein
VTTHQPSSGWSLDLHSGAGSGAIEVLEGVGPNMNATGYAQFSDHNGVPTATAEGLEGGSTQPLFGRQATRQQQSNDTFHGLDPFVATSTGAAKRVTPISGVAAIPSESC